MRAQTPDQPSHTDPQLRVAYLADHPEVLPVLRSWFETEWVDYYGPAGPGDAEKDLRAYSSREALPVGLVAFSEEHLCGIGVLKRDSVATHTHLSPWAAAGLVAPSFRRRGIGSRLLMGLEGVATALGYSMLYCGTSTAASLLKRSGWQLVECVLYESEDLSIYQKAL